MINHVISGASHSQVGEKMQTKSPEETRRIVDESARGLYFIAGTWVVFGLFIGYSTVFDALVMAALALWLQRSRSRIPAAILGVLSGLSLVIAAVGLLRVTDLAHTGNILVPGLVVWLAVRAFLAISAKSGVKAPDEVDVV